MSQQIVQPPATPERTAVPVIGAKVKVPRSRLDAVSRPRLVERLADPRYRVALLCAPAGFGKTVLVLDWLRQSGERAAWLSLDPLDNDPRRFFAHLAASLRSLPCGQGDAAETALGTLARSGGRQGTAELIAALTAGADGGVIVLDDVHHLEEPVLIEVLDALASGLSSGPRLVLLSRVDPPIRVSRLRMADEFLEIRAAQLRFSAEEASELLLRQLHTGLAPELVQRLEERTEGWAAGLRLAAVALEHARDPAAAVNAFTGSHQLVLEYLLEEAVGVQPEPLQHFLMETSILPRFTAEACAAVTGDPAAGAHLQHVDDANLFLIAIDDQQQWHRYHHLFAELLQYRLQRLMPERVEELRTRASIWFEQQGDVQEALAQAAALGTSTPLVELLDRHGYATLARSEFAAFGRWLSRVPDPLTHDYPMFLAALTWYRVQTERSPAVGELLEALQRAIEHPVAGYPAAQLAEARLHLGVLRAFVLRMVDQFEESLSLGEATLRQLPPDAARMRGVVEFNLGAVHLRLADMPAARVRLERAYEQMLRADVPYILLASLGHLGCIASHTEGCDAARVRLESAIAFAAEQRLDQVPAFAIVLYQLAQVHYLGDDLDRARVLLERALAITSGDHETDVRANVLIHLARVEAAAGRFERAEELLTGAITLAHGRNVKPFATTLDVERTRLAAARDGILITPEGAPQSVEKTDRWSTPREAETVLLLQHCLLLGRTDDAGLLADLLIRESEQRDRGVTLCIALLARAAATADLRVRRDTLLAGLELAARNGYIRPLLDGGEPIRALLETALHGQLPAAVRTFVRDVLPRFRQSEPTPAAAPALEFGTTLTERELEALALLAAGLSNKAIAQRMYVSLNTIKTHLKRIFMKLDVTTRTEAIERARSLGLITPPQP